MASPATPIVRVIAPEDGQGINTGIRIDQLMPANLPISGADLLEIEQGGKGRRASVTEVFSAATALAAGQNITITNGGTIGVTNPIFAPSVSSGSGIDLQLSGGAALSGTVLGGGIVMNGGASAYRGGLAILRAGVPTGSVGQGGNAYVSGGHGPRGGFATLYGGNSYTSGILGGGITLTPGSSGSGTSTYGPFGPVLMYNLPFSAGLSNQVYIDSATRTLKLKA